MLRARGGGLLNELAAIDRAARRTAGASVRCHPWVAYSSLASNLVPGDTNGQFDGFLFDRQSGSTIRMTVGAGGIEAQGESVFPIITPDGRYCCILSDAGNLVPGDTNTAHDVFIRDP